MNYLGRYLKKRLNELKVSEREISAKCGISHSYLNQLIKGINPSTKKNISPTLATFEKLAKGFGVSVDHLQQISRGIKSIKSNDGQECFSPQILKRIKDFQEFMMELGLDKKHNSEEEMATLISNLKKLVKKHYQELRK
ncbi:MAG: hypothetical protein A2Y25_03680 [Candidatus Melainabacteria bacterium GWF2_37_15]|nr:MAG: hypothetical protein A2Y25_03680 [Candidatus Melainabacteria bacterium GWF2_37_15]